MINSYDSPPHPLVIVSALGAGVGVVAFFAALARSARAAVDAAPKQLEHEAPQPSHPALSDDDPTFLGTAPTNDVEALARVIASEVGNYSARERLVVGWSVRNRAQRRQTTIVKLVCTPTCGPCCHGRPFSSYQAPARADIELARDILSRPQADDPTDGASAFFEPRLQDALVAAGDSHHVRTADKVRERWIAGGQKQLGTVGRIELWT